MPVDVGFRTEAPFVELDVTRGDIVLGSITFGFFFGFLVHVAWTAVLETRRAGRITAYVIMIWLEILGDIGFAITSWCYLYKVFPPGMGVFLTIIVCWIIQVQCLMLIIVNRLCILLATDRERMMLKAGVAGLVTLISVSTACIWIPAQLQINHDYIALNHWWDKFEKGIYLCLDLFLNIMFIVMVKKRLINHRLTKYTRVMKFNEYIIFVSIGMDILLMGMTTLKNPFVYCQFHPVVYIVKLAIEMSMSRLLIKVARSTGINVYDEERHFSSGTVSRSRQKSVSGAVPPGISIRVQNHVVTERDEIASGFLLTELNPTLPQDKITVGREDDASIASQEPSLTKAQEV
ncbi:hypothetical protein PQX77_009445 [Marasmius sp. AFHP31]|nr:hypothetical protein PQX77_009445 [Marasmius sp. AFHP31]